MTAKDPYPGLTALAKGRDSLPINEFAPYLTLKPQTVRKWACTGTGPIKLKKINGRLHAQVAAIRALLDGSEK